MLSELASVFCLVPELSDRHCVVRRPMTISARRRAIFPAKRISATLRLAMTARPTSTGMAIILSELASILCLVRGMRNSMRTMPITAAKLGAIKLIILFAVTVGTIV